jgi:crotonobetainyl-CoA:carnitine CoA-transferase CaiB-like acyl-CoA transferase
VNTPATSEQKIHGALHGGRVLDLSQGIAGPFAARLLGDHDADVIKVEPPHRGDEGRRLAPLKADAPEPEQSLLFQYLNWNKRSVALDLTTAFGQRNLRALIERSDILIESFRPGTLEAWGISVDTMLEWNPRLVVTSITNYGQTGPYARYEASDLTLQAMSGIMAISGQVDREPLKHGLSQSYYCAGLTGAYASIMAYTAAERFLVQFKDAERLCKILLLGSRSRRARATLPFKLEEVLRLRRLPSYSIGQSF